MKKLDEMKCWACGADLPLGFDKAIKACKTEHRALFVKSFAGETIEALLKRKPKYKKYL